MHHRGILPGVRRQESRREEAELNPFLLCKEIIWTPFFIMSGRAFFITAE